MRNYNIICLLLITLSFSALAQQVYNTDAIATALSGSDACYSYSWFGTRNPASLASLPVTSFGINYHNRYLISGLGSQSFFVTIASKGTWGYGIHYFGTQALNEGSFSVSYGRSIFRWLDLGIRMNGHRLSIEAFSEQSYTLSGDMGFIFKPSEDFYIGVHLVNPNRSEYFGRGYASLPSGVNAGFAYVSKQNFYLAAQLHWEDYSEIILSLGTEYWVKKSVALQTGLRVGSVISYSYGILFDYCKYSFALGFEQHTCLGMSTAVTLTYKFSTHVHQK